MRGQSQNKQTEKRKFGAGNEPDQFSQTSTIFREIPIDINRHNFRIVL